MDFIEQIAKTETGTDLVNYLKEVEIKYADIRNLNGVPAEVRIDALKIIREALLDKLLVLRGEIESPEGNEFA
jgi:hypothetical protein